MLKCAKCSGKLRRVHRTFFERFLYMAIYECHRCQEEQVVLRHYRYHFGEHSRCPRCGTYRVTRLKEPDKIDPMIGGLLNLLERFAGGKRLCHCRYCRIQFYDRREVMAASRPLAAAQERREMATEDAREAVGEAQTMPAPESAPPQS